MANVRTDTARVRDQRAVELRLGGATYDAIALQLGYTHRSAARKAVQRAIEREYEATTESREQLRQQMHARYERLVLGSWRAAAAGDRNAVANVLAALDRIGKLHGLDAPTQSKITVSSELDAEIEQLITELAARESGGNVVPLTQPNPGVTVTR